MWLRERRKELNITQMQLVARLQVRGVDIISDSTISHWEHNRYKLPLNDADFRAALSAALEMDVSELLTLAGFNITEIQDNDLTLRAALVFQQLPERVQRHALDYLLILRDQNKTTA